MDPFKGTLFRVLRVELAPLRHSVRNSRYKVRIEIEATNSRYPSSRVGNL